MINLDELKKKAEQATPGFWFHNNKDGVFILTTPHLEKYCIIPVVGDKDGAFISAFSPQSCLELIAKLRKAEEALSAIALPVMPGSATDPTAICEEQMNLARQALAELRGLGGGG